MVVRKARLPPFIVNWDPLGAGMLSGSVSVHVHRPSSSCMVVNSHLWRASGPSSLIAAAMASFCLSQDFSGAGVATVGRFLMLALVMAIIGGSPSLAVGLRLDSGT